MIHLPKFEKPFTGKVSNDQETPYLSARREWNEVYGQLVASAKFSRTREAVSWCFSGCLALALIFAALRPKFVPYIVEVNTKGAVLGAGIPSHGSVNEKMTRAVLSDWISFHRSVVRDPLVQRQYVDRVYAFLLQSDAASNKVNAWYQTNDPFRRSETELISVEVESILKQSANTFQIEWKESSVTPSGQALPPSHYRGLLTIEFHEISNGEAISRNPLGIIIKDISIAKIGG